VFCECTGLWQQLCAQEATVCDGVAPKGLCFQFSSPNLTTQVGRCDTGWKQLYVGRSSNDLIRKTLDSKLSTFSKTTIFRGLIEGNFSAADCGQRIKVVVIWGRIILQIVCNLEGGW
jgi:hypothetical protein